MTPKNSRTIRSRHGSFISGAVSAKSWRLIAILPALLLGVATAAQAAALPAVSASHSAELGLPNPSQGASGAQGGTAAALSADGKTALLGSPRRTVYSRQSGEGDAYALTSKGWNSGTELNLGAPAGNGSFIGQSVALSGSGNTALIGAPQRAIVGIGQAGAAYLYTRKSNGTWGPALRWNLGGKGGAFGDQFGRSVALSSDGKTALVGAPFHAADGVASAGAGEVYRLVNGTWQGPTELNLGKAQSSNIGDAVALNGNGHVALLGAPNQGNNGAVDVFSFTNGSWHKTGVLTVGNKNLGQAVAINAAGTIALVGGTGQDVYGGQNPGAAEVFVLKSGKWKWSHELNFGKHATSSDSIGLSVALNAAGTMALVGAPGMTVNSQQGAGAADLWQFTKGYWSSPVQIGLGKKAVQNDGLGTSVALNASGTEALLGAPNRSIGTTNTFTGAGELFTIH